MKETKTCPKCNAQDILRIPGIMQVHGAHNFIPKGPLPLLTAVPVTRYVCGQCGFSEEWIDSQEDLAKLEQKYG